MYTFYDQKICSEIQTQTYLLAQCARNHKNRIAISVKGRLLIVDVDHLVTTPATVIVIIIIINLFIHFFFNEFPECPDALASRSADWMSGNKIGEFRSLQKKEIYIRMANGNVFAHLFYSMTLMGRPSIHFTSSARIHTRNTVYKPTFLQPPHDKNAHVFRLSYGIYIVRRVSWRAKEVRSVIGTGEPVASFHFRVHADAEERPSSVTAKAQTANKFIIFSWLQAECQWG